MYFYYGFFLLLMICFGVTFKLLPFNFKDLPDDYVLFQKKFLSIYLLMVSADWIQAPYLYKLYSFYGFTKAEIGFLFVAGYASSAILGTVIASLSDRFGRKKIALVFCLLFVTSCLTKHFQNFNILLFGRILSGISTSILFSVFESYMVHKHRQDGLPEPLLEVTFSLMTFGSSLCAIFCGLFSSVFSANFGYVAPFDFAILFLFIGGIGVVKLWEENYGDRNIAPGANFAVGWVIMTNDYRIFLLGLIQLCFESVMHIFIFSWSPTLESTTDDEVDHGIVFGCFMISLMLGSYFFKTIQSLPGWDLYKLTVFNSLVASLSFLILAFVPSHTITLVSCCIFEVCLGIYYPSISTLRSKLIPCKVRATILNFFRIPLNIFTVLILLNVAQISHVQINLICAFLLIIACLAFAFLSKSLKGMGIKKESGTSSSPELPLLSASN